MTLADAHDPFPDTRPLDHRWRVAGEALPFAIAAYLIGLGVSLSSHRMMWLDEFFAWDLLTDPTLHHAMQAWLKGADSGGALYYILCHTLLAWTGPSVLAARLFGAVLLAGGYVLWYRVLRGVFDVEVSLLASGVLLVSVGYINYLAEIRFYSELLAMVVLAIWLALWLQRRGRHPAYAFALCFLVHGALVSSHLLGIVYSAMTLCGLLLCKSPKRYLAAAAGVVASWSLLLIARKPVRIGGIRVTSYHQVLPQWRSVLNYFHLQPTASPKANLVLYVLLLVTALQWLRRRPGGWPAEDSARALLFRLSFLLGTAPVTFFVESRIAPWPLWIARYMLPSVIGLSGLAAYALAFQLKRLSGRRRTAGVAAMAVAVAVLHVECVHHQVLRPLFTEEQLRPLKAGLPIMCSSEEIFFQLKYYESKALPSIYFVHTFSPTHPMAPYDLTREIDRQGYWTGSFRERAQFLAENNDFLMLKNDSRNADLLQQLTQSGWKVEALGDERLGDAIFTILRVRRPQA